MIDDCVRQWGSELESRYRDVKALVGLGVASAWIGACSQLAIHQLRSNSNAIALASSSEISPRQSRTNKPKDKH
jgi:hypothetical protein